MKSFAQAVLPLALVAAFAVAVAVASGCGSPSTIKTADAGTKKDAGGGNPSCSNPCGTQCCTATQTCSAATHTCQDKTCTPNCDGTTCGDDGCGGSCQCAAGTCNQGVCDTGGGDAGTTGCDPLNGASCPGGQACYPDTTGNMCMTPGTLAIGSTCQGTAANECVMGAICAGNPNVPNSSTCLAVCDPANAASCTGTCQGLQGASFGVCVPGGSPDAGTVVGSDAGTVVGSDAGTVIGGGDGGTAGGCDIYSAATSCGGGQACYLNMSNVGVCMAPGSVALGTNCTGTLDNECVPGGLCVCSNTGCTAAACMEMCNTTVNPTACASGKCSTVDPTINLGVCTSASTGADAGTVVGTDAGSGGTGCNALGGITACATGQSCYVTNPTTVATACLTTGAGNASSVCTNPNDCKGGRTCVNEGGATSVCAWICDTTNATFCSTKSTLHKTCTAFAASSNVGYCK